MTNVKLFVTLRKYAPDYDPDRRIDVEMGGGMVAVSGGKVLSSLPLPIAGLMFEEPVFQVHRRLEALHHAVSGLGCKIPDPFMTLSFLSLPVIPELKITDKGLVDVNQFKIVPLFGED